MTADELFLRQKVYVSLPASALRFADAESKALGVCRSHFITFALDLYKANQEEGRALILPIQPRIVGKGLDRERGRIDEMLAKVA